MEHYREDTITANGIRQHYYRAAPANPRATIILLHGITDNGMCWVRVADRLKEKYDVLLVDARGHGFSDAPENDYTSESRAADVTGLIQALGLNQPVLFGHSMGADTALTAAALYPDLVRAIILEDPPLRVAQQRLDTPEERQQAAAGWRAGILKNKALSTAELIAQVKNENPQWAEEELAPWAESKHQVHVNVANISLQDRQPWQAYLQQVRCPILLIAADPARGAIVTPENAKEAESIWQQGHAVTIPNAGHCIHRDQFDPTLRTVETFLDSL